MLLLLASVVAVVADDRTDALDAVAPLADALSNSDAQAFFRILPAEMPGRSDLRDNVAALMAQAEVSSSVEVINVEKDTADLDWYMEIRSRETRSVVERRRGVVKIRFRKRRLQFIEPASFFAPPKGDNGQSK